MSTRTCRRSSSAGPVAWRSRRVSRRRDPGAARLVAFVDELVGKGPARVLLDEWTMPLRAAWRTRLAHVVVVDAAVNLMARVKLVKTADELACIRAAQHLNEEAMLDVFAALRPGLRQCDLSGAFLARVFEL